MNHSFDNSPDFSNNFDTFQQQPPTNTGKPFAIASLVLGIVGICSCCCCIYWLNLIFGALAIVFAIVSARTSKDKKMSGLAIAGLILGILAVLIFLALFAFDLWFMSIPEEEFDKMFGEAIKTAFGEEFYNEYKEQLGFYGTSGS